jgi:hypothetical protein
MAQGPWGTGTWDDAQWDSLPISGNQATGGVGSPSVAVNAALTGVQATGAAGSLLDATVATLTGVNATGFVGTIANGISIELIGVQASGLAGNESESVTVALSGVSVTGSVGSFVSSDALAINGVSATGAVGDVVAIISKVVQLTGVQATGSVGNVTPPIPVIYLDDTHDPGPDKLKKQLKREQEKNKKRRDEIVAAYERIVEGKIPEEIIAPYVETFATIASKQNVTLTDIDKLMSNLDKMQLIWDDHIESDDEEILLL